VAGANVCLITLDTVRADRLGCYGNKDIDTPNLDALGKSGALFTRAYAPSPVTLPAHSSIMTGKYPYHHGVRVNALNRLSDQHDTMAGLLSKSGYRTAAFVSAHVLDPQYGLSRGFEIYDIDVSQASEHWAAVAERRADATTDRAIAWLHEQAGADQPFFLWVHFFDAHWEYKPPSPFKERYAENLYDGEIAFVDEQVGRLMATLAEIGAMDHTLVVAAGDHGESLGQHQESTHGTFIYDATMRVPLMIACGAGPGPGARIDRLVGLIDLLPTLLALLELPIPEGIDGIDLTRASRDDRTLFFETLEGLAEYGWLPFFGVQRGWLKYIHGSAPEMYDLSSDYLELDNFMLGGDPRRGDDLAAVLEVFYSGDLALAGSWESDHTLSAADLAKLQALGYAFGGSRGDVAPEDRLDPHEYLPLLREVNQAFDPTQDDWLARGITVVEKIVAEHPDFYVARKELGIAYIAHHELDKAEAQFRACLELRPDLIIVKCHLAQVRGLQGYFDEAITLYREIVEELPDDAISLARLGELLLGREKHEEALDVLERAHGLMPLHADVAMNRSAALSGLGRNHQAIEVLQAMLIQLPDDARVRTRLTRLLRSAARYEEAIGLLRIGVERQPEHLDFAVNLAINLSEWTDPTGARQREAVSILEHVNELTPQTNAAYLHALGRAYAAAGRLTEAIAASQTARTVAANAGQPTLAGTIDHDLSMFLVVQQRQTAGGSTTGPAIGTMDDTDPSFSTNGP
jgi:arylsulfatase A-like enzyme/Tfp pilus assembly protein PilF